MECIIADISSFFRPVFLYTDIANALQNGSRAHISHCAAAAVAAVFAAAVSNRYKRVCQEHDANDIIQLVPSLHSRMARGLPACAGPRRALSSLKTCHRHVFFTLRSLVRVPSET